jgi:hypothetical protein
VSAQTVSAFGLILDVIGAIIFIFDSNRLSGLLAGMVKHIAEDHGKWDSTQFKKEDLNDLQNKINSSRSFTRWGYAFFLIGFLLQLISNFIK